MKNQELAGLFDTIADVLEIKGENPFRVAAYRKTARLIGDLAEDVEDAYESGRLAQMRGIGESTLQKIGEWLKTGHMTAYEKACADVPASALDMLRIPGLGPKTVAHFMNELGIDSIDKLKKAIDEGRLEGVRGIGQKSIANILRGIELVKSSEGLHLISDAIAAADAIVAALADDRRIERIEPAGSVRRCRETVHDIDILAAVRAGEGQPSDAVPAAAAEVIERFASLPGVEEVLAAGKTKGSVRLRSGITADLRVVAPESFGAALQYFTGSKDHNVRLRGLAQDRGLKINEYGVFRGDTRVAGRTEEEVYAALDLPWIAPELREDRGEIEAAAEGRLPRLIERKDVRGELHAHTLYSDGALSVLDMCAAARDFGHKFIVISDHSKSLAVAHGLDEERLAEQAREIEEARKALRPFAILKGIEVDILPDGSLDLSDEALASLDWVIASVHSKFKMSEDEMTERMCRAARHPMVNAIGHPTGRLIGEREAYQVNVARLIEVCAEAGTALELNAHIPRLDLDDVRCRQARQAGAAIAIGTDAHHPDHFAMLRLGVGVARRAWLEPGDVVNTWTPRTIAQFVARKRKRR